MTTLTKVRIIKSIWQYSITDTKTTGLAAIQKKQGMNVDKNKNEKITDGLRGLWEKVTGKQVSSKISN